MWCTMFINFPREKRGTMLMNLMVVYSIHLSIQVHLEVIITIERPQVMSKSVLVCDKLF